MLHLGETRFHAPSPPRAMHPYQAGLALRSAQAARREIPGRQVSARALGAALEGVPGCQLPHPLESGEASWLRLPFLMDALPDELPLELRRLGVQRAYPRLLPVLYARHDRSQPGDPSFPGSQRLVREVLTAPTHSRVPPGRLAGALRTTLVALARRSFR
jgi:dTDP-4-amino-4,6-dideoxygalactose transaminase